LFAHFTAEGWDVEILYSKKWDRFVGEEFARFANFCSFFSGVFNGLVRVIEVMYAVEYWIYAVFSGCFEFFYQAHDLV